MYTTLAVVPFIKPNSPSCSENSQQQVVVIVQVRVAKQPLLLWLQRHVRPRCIDVHLAMLVVFAVEFSLHQVGL